MLTRARASLFLFYLLKTVMANNRPCLLQFGGRMVLVSNDVFRKKTSYSNSLCYSQSYLEVAHETVLQITYQPDKFCPVDACIYPLNIFSS